jgi:hypothetical protein
LHKQGSLRWRGTLQYLHVEGSRETPLLALAGIELPHKEREEEGLQGVFKRLRRNGHQLEKGLQMAQRGPSLK